MATTEPTLRERRRAETAREICDAALALFERQGSAATTVDQIAGAAGISQRTFFRYFARKEHAAFWTEIWNEDQARRMIDEAAIAVGAGLHPLAALTQSCSRVYVDFDRNEAESRRVLRQNRLVHADSGLSAVALQQENEIMEMAIERLSEALGDDGGSVLSRTAVRLAFAIFRATHEEWTRLNDLGQAVSYRSVYQRVIEEFQVSKGALLPTS